jgi:general L-amino acid transport system substrate-binding protein
MKKIARLVVGVVAGMMGTLASAATFDSVKERGFVNCGVGENFAGFFAPDSAGKWSGLDVDVCRALSAAIFGSAEKVKYLPATPATRFAQLQSS